MTTPRSAPRRALAATALAFVTHVVISAVVILGVHNVLKSQLDSVYISRATQEVNGHILGARAGAADALLLDVMDAAPGTAAELRSRFAKFAPILPRFAAELEIDPGGDASPVGNIEALTRSYELSPSADTAYRIGRSLEHSGEAEAAITWYAKAIEDDAPHLNAARGYLRLSETLP